MSSQTRYSSVLTTLMSQLVTIPFIRRPFQDLDDPGYYGITQCDNVKIPVPDQSDVESGNRQQHLGAWFCHPVSEGRRQSINDPDFRLPEDSVVFLYFHGNAETRSQAHRTRLYKLLQQQGYYVLTFDYRGFGDSSSLYPCETTLVEDALHAYAYLQHYIRPGSRVKVVVLGHSLGTGVACAFARAMQSRRRALGIAEDSYPAGFILMAPFNNIVDEVTIGFPWSAYFGSFFVNVPALIRASDVQFESDDNIAYVERGRPVIIMHAEDDNTVPYRLGQKLFDIARSKGVDASMITFPASAHVGHDYFVDDPHYAEYVNNFVHSL